MKAVTVQRKGAAAIVPCPPAWHPKSQAERLLTMWAVSTGGCDTEPMQDCGRRRDAISTYLSMGRRADQDARVALEDFHRAVDAGDAGKVYDAAVRLGQATRTVEDVSYVPSELRLDAARAIDRQRVQRLIEEHGEAVGQWAECVVEYLPNLVDALPDEDGRALRAHHALAVSGDVTEAKRLLASPATSVDTSRLGWARDVLAQRDARLHQVAQRYGIPTG